YDRAATAHPDYGELHLLQLADDFPLYVAVHRAAANEVESLGQHRTRDVRRDRERPALLRVVRPADPAGRRRDPARGFPAPHRELIWTVRHDDDRASRNHR